MISEFSQIYAVDYVGPVNDTGRLIRAVCLKNQVFYVIAKHYFKTITKGFNVIGGGAIARVIFAYDLIIIWDNWYPKHSIYVDKLIFLLFYQA